MAAQLFSFAKRKIVSTSRDTVLIFRKWVILNSDQGYQFTNAICKDFLKENGLWQSRWADNIMIERWFRSFKFAEAYLAELHNIMEAGKAIAAYVFKYNFGRYGSTINSVPPPFTTPH